jgi:glutaredoxin 3
VWSSSLSFVSTKTLLYAEMMQKTGRRTVPQIFIGDELIGGFSDLEALHRQDALKGRIFTQSQ